MAEASSFQEDVQSPASAIIRGSSSAGGQPPLSPTLIGSCTVTDRQWGRNPALQLGSQFDQLRQDEQLGIESEGVGTRLPAQVSRYIRASLTSLTARTPLRPEFGGARQKEFQRYPVGTYKKLALRFE